MSSPSPDVPGQADKARPVMEPLAQKDALAHFCPFSDYDISGKDPLLHIKMVQTQKYQRRLTLKSTASYLPKIQSLINIILVFSQTLCKVEKKWVLCFHFRDRKISFKDIKYSSQVDLGIKHPHTESPSL